MALQIAARPHWRRDFKLFRARLPCDRKITNTLFVAILPVVAPAVILLYIRLRSHYFVCRVHLHLPLPRPMWPMWGEDRDAQSETLEI